MRGKSGVAGSCLTSATALQIGPREHVWNKEGNALGCYIAPLQGFSESLRLDAPPGNAQPFAPIACRKDAVVGLFLQSNPQGHPYPPFVINYKSSYLSRSPRHIDSLLCCIAPVPINDSNTPLRRCPQETRIRTFDVRHVGRLGTIFIKTPSPQSPSNHSAQ